MGSSNTYAPPPGDTSDLKKNADGTWTLIDEDGAIYSFGATNATTGEATLTGAEIADATPGQGKLTYTFSGTRISTVSDQAGRSLSFNWSCTGALVCISGPDGVTWRLVGDASGRVARVDDGPISGQTPATSTWTFAYTVNRGTVSTTPTRAAHPGVPAGTVRMADGYTTVTPPNQQGASAPKVEKTYFDNLGHPMQTDDVLGNVTEQSYNALDQLAWTEDELGNPTDHAYDPIDHVLVLVTAPDPDGTGPRPAR